MKKFLMYVVVLVTVLFIGYTTYYFIRNNENIYLTLAEGESIYLNKDETYDLPLVWTKPYSSTKVYENIQISDTSVLSFDATTKTFIGKKGGIATITITPSNKDFGPFVFDVHVGDGSVMYPYFVQTAIQLANIGKEVGENWQLSHSYILVNDIDLKAYGEGWEPIGSQAEPFSGSFDGNGKTISNLKIVNGTNAGLFDSISSTAIVSNVNLVNPIISGSFDNAGAIAGISNGIIRLCKVTDLELNNSKADSNNGGIVGLSLNNSTNNNFTSFGYIDMCSVSVSAQTSGNFGGIVGKLVGSVVYNCKSIISSYTARDNSEAFGSIAGYMQDAQNTSTYMFSVIKNSYSIINAFDTNGILVKAGAIVGINQDSGTTNRNILKSIYYHSINTTLQPVGESASTIDVTTVQFKSVTDLYKQETYQGWNFETIWVIEEDASSAEIRFGEAQADSLGEYIPGEQITSEGDLITVLNGIKLAPNNGTVYEITSDIVIDLNGAEWTTIAPNSNVPMTSSLICDDGVSVIIRNFKISGNNSSFFGYMSGANTIVKGFTFENVQVNSQAQSVAVIATSLLDNALVENCEVKNAEITAGEQSNNVAVVVAVNYGRILNCKVNSQVGELNRVTAQSQSLNLGGISAVNARTISNCEISMYDFDVTTSSTSASLHYGGIVGNLEGGNLTNCYNFDCSLDLTYYGTVYAGGVAGYVQSGSTITKCFSEGLIKLPTTNENSYVGGISGYANISSIKQCYYANQTLEAYNVAGIVQTSYADVDQCYFQGEAKGVRVAGLVGFNNRTVTNCYVLGSLVGTSSSAKVSGLVSTLPVGSLVEHCFSSASFDGEGEKHAETEAEFRATIEKIGQLFNQYPDTGELKNCIIINYGDAYVKATVFGWIKPGWIDCTDAQAKGLQGDYSVFKNDASFDQSLWNFYNNNGEGAYPTLKYVVVNPNNIVNE